MPYVSGWHRDEYEEWVSKARNPFNGNDCSGLAFCAGYDAGMTIDKVYTAVLKAHYYDPNLTKADRQTGDLWSVLGWSHVGIYYTDYIIHASSTNDKVVKREIDEDSETDWWFINFSGLGRK